MGQSRNVSVHPDTCAGDMCAFFAKNPLAHNQTYIKTVALQLAKSFDKRLSRLNSTRNRPPGAAHAPPPRHAWGASSEERPGTPHD